MPAYLIVDIETTDQAMMDEYRKLVPATLAKYGAKFLVRGGTFEKLEGDWHPKALRLKCSKGNLVLVEGAS